RRSSRPTACSRPRRVASWSRRRRPRSPGCSKRPLRASSRRATRSCAPSPATASRTRSARSARCRSATPSTRPPARCRPPSPYERRQVNAALVTGASAGIGRAFAHALVARGHDIVLVARDRTRLDALAAELRDRFRVGAEVLVADIATDDGIVVVEQRLLDAARPADLLVNNAGMGTFGPFVGSDVAREADEVRLNVLALLRLTHAALRSMTTRDRGAIVNISSLAGYQPTPNSATYGATKAFVNSFTRAIREEVRGSGVHVMLVCPGYTRTEFHDRAGLGPT